MTTINFFGCGKVGQTLGHLWHQNGVFLIQDVLNTSMESAERACFFMGAGKPVSSVGSMRPAEVWVVGVQDAHVPMAVVQLALAFSTIGLPEGPGPRRGPVVFHCSGALSSSVLKPLAALGAHTASAHCILSFASAETAVTQFAGTACALEGAQAAIQVLQPRFEAVGAQCFGIDGDQKLIYHAAAVFATNFLPVLQAVAEDAWRSTGVPEPIVHGLRASLLQNAVANIVRSGPQQALTGPAARGDVAAIATQSIAVSAWDAQAGAAYDALSALALRIAKANRDTAATKATSH